jgi:hypothetical protein
MKKSYFLDLTYNITVYTGDKPNAGTDARVYIVMHGNKASSNRIFLNNGKFERKSIDSFPINVPDNFGPLTSLDVGHDNSGMASGWYLNKVCKINEINVTHFILIPQDN